MKLQLAAGGWAMAVGGVLLLLGGCLAGHGADPSTAGIATSAKPAEEVRGPVAERFDAAPFASVSRGDDGRAVELRWAEPRKIRQVEVAFAGRTCPQGPADVRVEYWQGVWDGRADPPPGDAGACGQGWWAADDWTNGRWQEAQCSLREEGRCWVITFAPTGPGEFPDRPAGGVGYRRTLKLRLTAAEAWPEDVRISALTDAFYRPLSVRLFLDAPAHAGIHLGAVDEQVHLEVYNGLLEAVRPAAGAGAGAGTGPAAGGGAGTRVAADGSFRVPPGGTAAVEADLRIAVDPFDGRYDRTIVTVRSSLRPFSFAADEVARGERILVDDLGALIVRSDDPATLASCRAARKESSARTVYARVFDEPEQTLMRAWNDMPLKRALYFVHGLPGNRNTMRQMGNGEIVITSDAHWFNRPRSPRDSERKQWPGGCLTLGIGFPEAAQRGGRELRAGYLPVLRTWWQQGGLLYEQLTVLDTLDGRHDAVRVDDPTVLLAQVRVLNTSATGSATASLTITSTPQDHDSEPLELRGDTICALTGDGARIRALVQGSEEGHWTAAGPKLCWTEDLAPGQSRVLQFCVPAITVERPEELEALRGREFETTAQAVCEFWRTATAGMTRIETPEPWLNDFYRAHARHLLINCQGEVDSERRHAHVGSFYYGDFPNEAIMMISDLDRRGRSDVAEHCLEAYLHSQGTVPLPGNFASSRGLFYGSGGHEMGGYNKSHGYVCWGMAEHWWQTRDRAWMERVAPQLVEACAWIIRERQATMVLNPDGSRPIEYGFLPAGGLEDVQDYWYWQATNSATVWGFDALAAALQDYGHPQADRLATEARAYHADVLAGLTEARVRAPVVRLRDGTSVPKYPSHLHLRGRALGWIRETLEGPLFLLHYGLIAPDAPEADWILQDYEDNLYISEGYGYSIPVFDQFWFSRGGFSMQANLLDGPPPYLYRDQIKHYLRAYFNGFASAFYPDVRMCNEHSAPELGYPAGDHFKSSDEAQSTLWLRQMFVREAGRDLYLGSAIPRYWMADGQTVAIEGAATHFGPLSLRITSQAAAGRLEARLDPPVRNPPERIRLRLRHPEGKPMQRVTINGRSWDRFDAAGEWIDLPGDLAALQTIVAEY